LLLLFFIHTDRVTVLAVTWQMNRERKWRHIWVCWRMSLSMLWYVAMQLPVLLVVKSAVLVWYQSINQLVNHKLTSGINCP